MLFEVLRIPDMSRTFLVVHSELICSRESRNYSYRDEDLGHLPLSLDERLVQGDAFLIAMKTLETNLASIEHFYATPGSGEAGNHSGQPTDCRRCDEKKKQIRQAYCKCYLSADTAPEQWDANYPQYRQILSKMFDDESCKLEDICAFHDMVLKEHIHQDIIQSLPLDTLEDQKFSSAFSAYVWDNDASIEDIFGWYFKYQPHIQRSQAISEFVHEIQDATAELRAQIYIKYYCNILPNDPPALRNFKSKYARQFAELNTHDVVLAAMQEEAETYQVKTLEQLRGELSELQLAKSATMKHKKRKAEQADQRMLDVDMDDGEYVSCALPSCPLDVELSDTIECIICDWLVRKGGAKSRVYYCSVEHSEEDFVS